MTTDFDRYQAERPRRIRGVSVKAETVKPSVVEKVKALRRYPHGDETKGTCLVFPYVRLEDVIAILEAE